MTAQPIREAVKNAVCGSMACDARCKPEMKIKACGIVADAALAVAMPIISDEEVEPFLHCGCKSCRENVKKDLAAFLKGRVPDARDANAKQSHSNHRAAQGFNACRDIVLRGGK